MTEIAFTMLQRPDGQWTLREGDKDRGVYATPALAEEAIQRIRAPNIRYYNRDGELIHSAETPK